MCKVLQYKNEPWHYGPGELLTSLCISPGYKKAWERARAVPSNFALSLMLAVRFPWANLGAQMGDGAVCEGRFSSAIVSRC